MERVSVSHLAAASIASQRGANSASNSAIVLVHASRSFAAGRARGADARALAERFVQDLLRDSFGFASLSPVAPVVIAERGYPIGFSALGGRVPVVIAPAQSGLETPAPAFGDGGRRRSAFGLAQNLGIERTTAQAYIDSYFSRYPGVKRYMDETRDKARADGFVETVFGRRLWLPEIRSANPQRRAGAERAAINAPMQGTAADLIKLAMIAVQGWLDRERLATRLIMQVHDELVLEVPEGELAQAKDRLRDLMQGVAELSVPLIVDVGVGDNWDQAH